jgi:hypothetical protein
MTVTTTEKTAIFGSLWNLQESPSLCWRCGVRLLFLLKTFFPSYNYVVKCQWDLNVCVQMSTMSLERTTIIVDFTFHHVLYIVCFLLGKLLNLKCTHTIWTEKMAWPSANLGSPFYTSLRKGGDHQHNTIVLICHPLVYPNTSHMFHIPARDLHVDH